MVAESQRPLGTRSGWHLTPVLKSLNDVPLWLAFVIFAIPIGTFLVFAQPPGQGLDETVHFYRVWTLARGAIVAPSHHGIAGGNIPQCVVDYINRFSAAASRSQPFSFTQYWQNPVGCYSKSVFTDFTATAVYSPVVYVPSVLSVAVLRLVHAPLPVIFFGGRLTTLLAFVGLYALAIRIIPIGRQVLFVLGLLPTTLLLASSYSEDSMTIALAALSVALTLRCCRSTQQERTAFVLLVVVLIALGLAKPTYLVMAFLILMVPASAIGPMRHPSLMKTAGLAVSFLGAGIWYVIVRNVLKPVPLYRIYPHTQTRFVLDHPISFLGVLARTFFESTGEQRWVPGFFFSVGYQRPFNDNIYAPVGIVIVGVLTLFYAYQLQFGAKRLEAYGLRLMIWLPVALTGVGTLLVDTTLFLYGTPVGLPEVNTQGRYLYPLVLLPLVTIGLLREVRVRRRSTLWLMLGVTLMLVWLVLKIFVHDYSL